MLHRDRRPSRSRPRRLNRRILIAMLAVALIPVATLTAVVSRDFAAVNQATVDEAHRTVVADAEQRETGAVTDAAIALQSRVDALNGEMFQLASTVDAQLKAAGPATVTLVPAPGGARRVVDDLVPAVTVLGAQTSVPGAAGTRAADPVGSARGAVAGALDTLRRHHPELTAVWLYDTGSAELTITPVLDPTSALENDRVDPTHLLDRQLDAALYGADSTAATASHAASGPNVGGGGRPSFPAWSDIATSALGSGSSVTVWVPITNHPGEYVGAELSSDAITGLLAGSVSTLPDAYPIVLSPTGRWMSAGAPAAVDFALSPGYIGTPFAGAAIAGQSHTGGGSEVVTARLGKQDKELFVAPIPGVKWTLATVVPTRELAPAAAALGDGIRQGVRRTLLLQVLPFAIALCAIAVLLSYLLSRRLVGPVLALTASAERLAQGRTDEPVPPQGEDEVGMLAETLERMRREINTSRDAILAAARELEGRVAERTTELRERNEELVSLNRLAGSLTRSLDPMEILSGGLEALGAILPLRAGRGCIIEGGRLRVMLDTGDVGDGTALAGAASAALAAADLSIREADGSVLVGLPLATRDGAMGAIALRVADGWRATGRVLHVLRAVADQVGLALRTAELSAEGQELAVVDERTRLAREIHDTLAQQLTGIVLQLEAAEALVARDSGRAGSLVVAARDQARLALGEARRSVWNLRPSSLETTGLAGAIAVETARFSDRTGIPVHVDSHGLPRDIAMSPQAEVALFRILQEALTNAGRHSGAANIDVELRREDGDVVMGVRDDGEGFSLSTDENGLGAGTFGLVGMEERARLVGARLLVDSRPEHGTLVEVRLPLGVATRPLEATG